MLELVGDDKGSQHKDHGEEGSVWLRKLAHLHAVTFSVGVIVQSAIDNEGTMEAEETENMIH